jgi:hypothetical protein
LCIRWWIKKFDNAAIIKKLTKSAGCKNFLLKKFYYGTHGKDVKYMGQGSKPTSPICSHALGSSQSSFYL